MSACQRVFAVTELNEQILLHLPLNELLRTFQVCRTWAQSTLRIRQVLYLEPTNQLLDLNRGIWKLHEGPAPNRGGHRIAFDEDTDMDTEKDDHSEYEDGTIATDDDEDERLEYEEDSSVGEIEAATQPATTLDPSRGPILNPFINIFIEDDYDGPSLISLGIVTFPYVEADDAAVSNGLGHVDIPDYLIWKLGCSIKSFRDMNASWQSMQVMQPAVTELRTRCCGFETILDENGKPIDFGYSDDEHGVPQPVELDTFGQDYWVRNPNGVTLGDWVEMYQRHHAECPYCVYKVDEWDDHYGSDAPFDRWMFDACEVTRKLEPNLPNGREVFVRDPNWNDTVVLPGSGFSGHYVLASIEDTLRPVVIPDEAESGEEPDEEM